MGAKSLSRKKVNALKDMLNETSRALVFKRRIQINRLKIKSRPDFVTDEHLEYLDGLRESGVTNMFGARAYLLDEFDALEEKEAGKILTYWMKTFGDRVVADEVNRQFHEESV